MKKALFLLLAIMVLGMTGISYGNSGLPDSLFNSNIFSNPISKTPSLQTILSVKQQGELCMSLVEVNDGKETKIGHIMVPIGNKLNTLKNNSFNVLIAKGLKLIIRKNPRESSRELKQLIKSSDYEVGFVSSVSGIDTLTNGAAVRYPIDDNGNPIGGGSKCGDIVCADGHVECPFEASLPYESQIQPMKGNCFCSAGPGSSLCLICYVKVC